MVIYIVDLRCSLGQLSEDGLESVGVLADDSSDASKLRVAEDRPQLFRADLSAFSLPWDLLCRLLSRLLVVASQIGRDAVDQILHCPLHVVESSSQSLYALLAREAHRHQLSDFCLVGGLLGRLDGRRGLRRFLLALLNCLFLLLLLFLLLGCFRFGLLLGFGLRLLLQRMRTATCAITTMKSVSLMASFSMVSSLATVLPLNTILRVSAGRPLVSWILFLRV
jgi:hypothetical protein